MRGQELVVARDAVEARRLIGHEAGRPVDRHAALADEHPRVALADEDADAPSVGGHVADRRVEGRTRLGLGLLRSRRDRLQRLPGRLGEDLVEDGGHQLVEVGEALVEVPVAQARAGADAAHGRPGGPVLTEELEARLHELATPRGDAFRGGRPAPDTLICRQHPLRLPHCTLDLRRAPGRPAARPARGRARSHRAAHVRRSGLPDRRQHGGRRERPGRSSWSGWTPTRPTRCWPSRTSRRSRCAAGGCAAGSGSTPKGRGPERARAVGQAGGRLRTVAAAEGLTSGAAAPPRPCPRRASCTTGRPRGRRRCPAACCS